LLAVQSSPGDWGAQGPGVLRVLACVWVLVPVGSKSVCVSQWV